MSFIEPKRQEYFRRRVLSGCSACGTVGRVVDPISGVCRLCRSKHLSHGSPIVPKPKLKHEMKTAFFQILSNCTLEEPTRRFNEWMQGFSSPSKQDPLKRLCWLNYFELKSDDGRPLLDFRQSLVQGLALTIYDRNGGRIDDKRKQFNYLLGRSVCTVWDKQRQVANGTTYDQKERRNLQRKPKVMHRAFDEIFLGAGFARFISKLNNQMRKK